MASASASIRRRQPLPSPTTLSQEPIFQDSADPSKKMGRLPKKTKGGGSPHLHSHSMEEQLLNPHYNQSKFSPDRYMMLNRDRDRERGLPLCWLFETNHRNGANSHVPSSLVWFREPPPPPSLTRLLKAVILDFISYAGKSASPFYKND